MKIAYSRRIVSFTGFVAAGLNLLTLVVLPTHGKTTTIAITGDQAPGVMEGVTFQYFPAIPVLNNAGQVAYLASLTGTDVVATINDRGIWRDNKPVARSGDPAYDFENHHFHNFFSSLILNDLGQVQYEAILTPNIGLFADGIWRDSTLIVSVGQPAIGFTNAQYRSIAGGALNNVGQVAFSGDVQSTIGHDGIWRDMTLLVRSDNSNNIVGIGTHALNDVGQVVYRATLDGFGQGEADTSIWRDTTLIARAGDRPHGISDDNIMFGNFDPRPGINNAGQVVYSAFLHGPNGFEGEGLWRDTTLIFRTGDPAPGIEGDVHFQGGFSAMMNNRGQIAHTATLSGTDVDSTNNRSIWRDTTLVVREGHPAPDIGDGVNFGGFGSPTLNEGGQVAYFASLTGSNTTVTNRASLWITGPNDQSLLIARTGDELAGRTIRDLEMLAGSGGADGRSRSLNNFSQVVYKAIFTNGDQGIFLFTPDLHWISQSSGNWDDSGINSNWTIGQKPGDPHNIFIDPNLDLTVTGPDTDVTVENLQIGGGDGVAILSLGNGVITSPNTVRVFNSGVFTGHGIIDAELNVNGQLSPGNSPGIIHVTQDTTLESISELIIELGGTISGDQYDKLIVDGLLSLEGGTLRVMLVNSFIHWQAMYSISWTKLT